MDFLTTEPLAFASLVLATATFADEPAEKLRFNRDVRPILDRSCVACHRTRHHR